jgi:centromeric protein E
MEEDGGHRVWTVSPQYSSIAQTTQDGKPLSDHVMGRTFISFNKMFGEDATMAQVYEDVAQGIVSSIVNGLNVTIFAHGQTSSRKMCTMQGLGGIMEGWEHGNGGIIEIAAQEIVQHIQNTPNRIFLVCSSSLEIYSEEVCDLLGNNQELPIS